jgi:hypothetical protein
MIKVQVLTEITGRQSKRYLLDSGGRAVVEASTLTRDEQAQGFLDAVKGNFKLLQPGWVRKGMALDAGNTGMQASSYRVATPTQSPLTT